MKKTILLADDDPSVRENLARVLELDDYLVVRASGGAEAAEKILSARNPTSPCSISIFSSEKGLARASMQSLRHHP